MPSEDDSSRRGKRGEEDGPSRFEDLGLIPEVLAAIRDLGFEVPTPIQSSAIPFLVDGHDLIGKAETGTGKTLAFIAPMLGRMDLTRVSVQGLVLCPTRELAQQVEETARDLGKHLDLKTALLVGGVHQGGQILRLREGAQLVVGTPGRVLEMIDERYLKLGWTSHAVLDEADRMLDMGFIDDVSRILEMIPEERQTMLFSATIPPDLDRLARRFMRSPKTVATTRGTATVPKILQFFLRIHPYDKEQYLFQLLDESEGETCIVFCNTRRKVKELDRLLWGRGYPAGALHGDQDQDTRFKILDAFKSGEINTLVATDVAARGLDIDGVTRVVNFDVPIELDTYVHRIGRTGRAGEEGEAILLVTRADERSFDAIARDPKIAIDEFVWEPEKRERPPRRDDGHRSYDRGRRDSGRGNSRRGGSSEGRRRSGRGGSRRT
ncbi:MAG: DEAD/DEAH box helicase [Planctomycetes bacterium]|nr:DEAD/DEAH box helicase [Planctomycetota bacterium]